MIIIFYYILEGNLQENRWYYQMYDYMKGFFWLCLTSIFEVLQKANVIKYNDDRHQE